MADRIAVMNAGVLQQVGTPREIFETPANTFVANFVGEPAMNLLDVEVARRGDSVELHAGAFAFSVRERSLIRRIEQTGLSRFTCGIRPMHISASVERMADASPATVYVLEPLDEFNIVSTQAGNHRLLVETSPDFRPQMDDTLWLQFPEDKLHLFNPETGVRVI
jgi:ABC-type sugar transport system ATPase subunit